MKRTEQPANVEKDSDNKKSKQIIIDFGKKTSDPGLQFTDFEIQCKDEHVVYANKCVLVKNIYFKTLFTSGLRDTNIWRPKCTARAMNVILNYLYNNTNDEIFQHYTKVCEDDQSLLEELVFMTTLLILDAGLVTTAITKSSNLLSTAFSKCFADTNACIKIAFIYNLLFTYLKNPKNCDLLEYQNHEWSDEEKILFTKTIELIMMEFEQYERIGFYCISVLFSLFSWNEIGYALNRMNFDMFKISDYINILQMNDQDSEFYVFFAKKNSEIMELCDLKYTWKMSKFRKADFSKQ